MPKKDFTLSSKILLGIVAAEEAFSPFTYHGMLQRLHGRRNSIDVTLHRLYKKGWIRFVDKDGQRFLKITKNGQIEALIAKARIPSSEEWDGKWRLIFFDIPESAKAKRNLLRDLLKRNNFRKLQASAYISPYTLNREAVTYLKETKLINFIRIAKVEEMDDDRDLKKIFGLK